MLLIYQECSEYWLFNLRWNVDFTGEGDRKQTTNCCSHVELLTWLHMTSVSTEAGPGNIAKHFSFTSAPERRADIWTPSQPPQSITACAVDLAFVCLDI